MLDLIKNVGLSQANKNADGEGGIRFTAVGVLCWNLQSRGLINRSIFFCPLRVFS